MQQWNNREWIGLSQLIIPTQMCKHLLYQGVKVGGEGLVCLGFMEYQPL